MRTFNSRREGGVALLTALVLMLAVLMTGIASTRGALQGARAAAHERDRVLALQMADAALLDAERDIEGGAEPGSARANAIAGGSADAFVAGCAGGRPYNGLCAHAADPDLLSELLADDDGPAILFGSFTGLSMPDGEGALPLAAPRYLIELMPATPDGQLYRITARGAGSMPGTHAALQAYYRKPPDGGRGRRVGWRELGNWSEAYAMPAATAAGHPTGTDRRKGRR
ncbi:type IV pilus assembly protein PilX [Massilia sp. UYP11]|uniref:pilus assembly PilX family protein n=1 Tax=Massilia sp. UYP11 TaxID=1756385 RepID=UPI003D1B2AB1